MPETVSIRNATPDDAIVVANLIVQLGYDITIDAARRRLVQLLGKVDNAIYVAIMEGRVVGVVHVAIMEALEHEPRGEIRALVVEEEHRSMGIGERLVQEAEKWAKARRLSMMRVRSNTKRDLARRFYERYGYEVTKTSNVFDKKL